jgi:hypothetical protein
LQTVSRLEGVRNGSSSSESDRVTERFRLPRNLALDCVMPCRGASTRKRNRDSSTTVLVTQPEPSSDMPDYTIRWRCPGRGGSELLYAYGLKTDAIALRWDHQRVKLLKALHIPLLIPAVLRNTSITFPSTSYTRQAVPQFYQYASPILYQELAKAALHQQRIC